MRIRTIKPEFHQAESLARLPREDRLLAAALLNWADDEGYFRSHPALVAGALFPFDADGRAFVTRGMAHLAEVGFLRFFEGGIGHIAKFAEHQIINKPTKSRLSLKATVPLIGPDSRTTPVVLPEDSGGLPEDSHTEVEGKWKGSGREVETEVDKKMSTEPLTLLVVEPTPDPIKNQATKVFEHWREVFRKDARTIFSDERREAVEGRLREGRTVEDLKQAVNGCALTPHNMGENERGTKYIELELICRTAAQVDRFMESARAPPKPRVKGSVIHSATTWGPDDDALAGLSGGRP